MFYRREKYEYPGAGFRYEGPFEYVSYDGGSPAHFLLRRIGHEQALIAVESEEDIRKSVRQFNAEAAKHQGRAQSLLKQTTYWVFDPDAKLFGPGKFVGYKNMTFDLYERGNQGVTAGDAFSGGTTREAISRVLHLAFGDDHELSSLLLTWAEQVAGPGVIDSVDPTKWQFVRLTRRAQAASDEVQEAMADAAVAAVEAAQARARGQGFASSLERRRAVEQYAMSKAHSHWESLGFEVEVTAATEPYDLLGRKDNEVVYVEVKGTTAAAEQVILTRNEVRHAEEHGSQSALFILHDIEVTGEDVLEVSGGKSTVYWPWNIGDGELEPLSFVYRVPFSGAGE